MPASGPASTSAPPTYKAPRSVARSRSSASTTTSSRRTTAPDADDRRRSSSGRNGRSPARAGLLPHRSSPRSPFGATPKLLLDRVDPDSSRGQERIGVEDHVRDLLDEALDGLAGSGHGSLESLLAHLGRGERRVVEQRDDVRAGRPLPFAF